ncbi:MAG: threonine--tRNA ligase, partial [Candidatus Magasanikbacteria bacterium CG_4_9_14_0_2_um_filter_42_11]
HTEKYINEPENWKYSEQVLREVLEEMKVEFVEVDDEAAFYGPKVDVQVRSVIGREETMSTIQLDFLAKSRFGLSYTDEEGNENNDVFVIHRAPLSVHERFLAFLIEHYAGVWPVWMSPVQVHIVPVSEKHIDGARTMVSEFIAAGIRVSVDEADETVGKKIRNATKGKHPYILVVGDKELSGEDLMIRVRGQEEQVTMSKEAFIEKVKKEISERIA